MNGGQLLMVLGSIALFSLINLSANRITQNSLEERIEAEGILTATAVAEQVLNEARSRSFDDATSTAIVDDVQNFSYSLGPESGETLSNFNDVDDYNNHSRAIATPRVGVDSVNVAVDYVSPGSPDTPVGYQTRMKRVAVTVSNPMLSRPLTLYYYYSY